MAITMTKGQAVVAVFRNKADSDGAYAALVRRGYTENEISILMSDATRASMYADEGDQAKYQPGTLAVEGMGVGGAAGAAVGATIAALAALGTTLVIPGLNLVVAGPLAAALAGGGAGAVTGGLIGGLAGAGFTEESAEVYHAAVNAGGVVISVVPRTAEEADAIEQEFKHFHGENVHRV